jgi:serine O-acetyltransferase
MRRRVLTAEPVLQLRFEAKEESKTAKYANVQRGVLVPFPRIQRIPRFLTIWVDLRQVRISDFGLLPRRLRYPWISLIVSAVQSIVNQLTDRLVESYGQAGGINHLDGKNLPSKSAIALITCDLLRLLFPGFFDEKLLHSSEVRSKTSALLAEVMRTLEIEVAKSLEYNPPPELQHAKKNLRPIAHTYTVEFLESLPRVRELLQTDTEAAFNGDPAALSKEEVIVAYPFIEAIAVQRLAHELYLKNIPLIPRIMTEWAHARTGMDLHPGAVIGTHFFVDHCTGTVVGETTILGNHVKMYQGVGLVAASLAAGQQLRGKKRHPTVEDNVTIYAGATIMGGDTVVGEYSTIGANVFLTSSVPPHSLVIQEEANVKVMNKKDRQKQTADFTV